VTRLIIITSEHGIKLWIFVKKFGSNLDRVRVQHYVGIGEEQYVAVCLPGAVIPGNCGTTLLIKRDHVESVALSGRPGHAVCRSVINNNAFKDRVGGSGDCIQSLLQVRTAIEYGNDDRYTRRRPVLQCLFRIHDPPYFSP